MTRGAAEFEVASLGGGRRGRGPGAAAAVVVMAIGLLVGGGLLSNALFPPAPSLTPASSTEGAVAPTPSLALDTPGPLNPSDPPQPRLTVRPASRMVDVATLVAGVRDGSYSNKVIFVSGRLRATSKGCSGTAPAPACFTLRIDGLRGLNVVPDAGLGGWIGEPAVGTVLALLVAGNDLVYLGALVVSDAGIPGVGYVTGDFNTPGSTLTPPTNLVEADGLLAMNQDVGCRGSMSTCGRPAPQLLPTTQLGTTKAWYGTAIDILMALNLPGVNPADNWIEGLFLLRRTGVVPGWEVVARETADSVVSVVLP